MWNDVFLWQKWMRCVRSMTYSHALCRIIINHRERVASSRSFLRLSLLFRCRFFFVLLAFVTHARTLYIKKNDDDHLKWFELEIWTEQYGIVVGSRFNAFEMAFHSASFAPASLPSDSLSLPISGTLSFSRSNTFSLFKYTNFFFKRTHILTIGSIDAFELRAAAENLFFFFHSH